MESAFEQIKNRFEFTDEAKGELLRRWMASQEVHSVLGRHAIAVSFFGRFFGSKVINYAVGVIEGRNKLGNCPVIGVMLVFFEKKNLPLGDVFMICVNLKNAFIELALEQGKLDKGVLHEICTLVDRNFHGVIVEYLHMHYEEAPYGKMCSIECDSKEPISVYCTTMAPPPSAPATSAADYALEVEIDRDIQEELNEIEEETLSSLGLTESISQAAKGEVIDLFTQYAKMLERLVEFQELSYALWMLIDLLKEMRVEDMVEESTYVVIYVKAIINDLSAWRNNVFIEQNAEDIHYLDKTLLSSIAQLQILLSPQESETIDDVEFF